VVGFEWKEVVIFGSSTNIRGREGRDKKALWNSRGRIIFKEIALLGDAASLMMMMAKGSSKQKVAVPRLGAFHYLVHYTKSLPGATRLSGREKMKLLSRNFAVRSQLSQRAKLFNALIMCVSTENFD
jgi:hypothetical protein